MFTPMDFQHEMARFRRQMNHMFRDFDRSFSVENDPFFRWNQRFMEETDRPMLDGAPLNMLNREQKESGEQKHAGGSPATGTGAGNQMAVESSNLPVAAGSGAATSAPGNAVALAGGQLQPHTLQQSLWNPGSLMPSLNSVAIPRVDVVENADHYLVNCDLPGMSKDDVKLSVTAEGVLSICAEHAEQHEQKDDSAKYHRIERSYGKFKRALQLPDNVDIEAVKAKHEHGLLQITLPKKPKNEPKQPKSILIH